MLQYIYCEDFEIGMDVAVDLFKLSHEYNLKKLNKDCEKALRKNITVENVMNNISLAEKYEAEKLRNACLFFITTNLKEAFRTQNMRDLENETLLDLIEFSNSHTRSKKHEFEYYL